MGTYRVEWTCCGSVTETDAWEPSECPICEAAALRKDAERYRWLRKHHSDALLPLAWSHGPAACAIGGDTDAAIDAAMNGANEQDNGGQQG